MSFRNNFPTGAKMLCSPTNQMAACTCHTDHVTVICIWMHAKIILQHICTCTVLELQHCCTTAPPIPWENFTLCTGNSYSHGAWWSFLCLLMSFVLVLPSDCTCVGEPCMVPVGDVTTAKLCLNRGLVRQCKGLYLSLKPASFFIL